MGRLTKKTTILFPPRLYQQLEAVAKKRGKSVGQLVRDAAVQRYLLPEPKARREAVEAIAAMDLPAPDWEQMEAEIARGAAGER